VNKPGPRVSFLRRPVVTFLLALAVGGAAVTVRLAFFPSAYLSNPVLADNSLPALAFVGSTTCADCHQNEAQMWQTSQHKKAMAHATAETVLGDFNDAGFEYYGVLSRFFQRDGKYFVETDGSDGKLATFEIKYTFGVEPLQQYLIEFPDGRIQALSIAWDTRPKERGGQRWFHLYPNEHIQHNDVLHWTKLNQNWNFMCAECHSTGVHKNYDPAKDRFATSFQEISVGCEACHGQGSRHVAWAKLPASHREEDRAKGLLVKFDERPNARWVPDQSTGNVRANFKPSKLRKEVETCGLCHARRSQFSEDWIPGRWLSDTHVVSPLTRGLYHVDGQMLDEVYNYGSFKQSKMFAAGVTCSDCHEPHSAKLRSPGDGVCAQCHSPEKYAADRHRHHPSSNETVGCASCHMPTHTYMVVDQRHDHSFRVPRPDVSARLGTPNACNDCHTDQTAAWAASTIETWFGAKRIGFQNYADAFQAAATDQPNAAALLAAVASEPGAPGFARAGALGELATRVSPSNLALAKSALSDPDPMVRLGGLEMLAGTPPLEIWPVASPLLSDVSPGVRIRTAALLAAVPAASQPTADRDSFAKAAAEFIAAQRQNSDRPEARTALANFFARRGSPVDAEIEYRVALRLNPQFTPAAANLADLFRTLGRNTEGERVLRDALLLSPADAAIHYSLGLALIRLTRRDEALIELKQAAELAPDNARYSYVYAIALRSLGRRDEALKILNVNAVRHPGHRDTLSALIEINTRSGDFKAALGYAEQLSGVDPADSRLAGLIVELKRRAAISGSK
jgi:tetratricopeptide (TPR) repeat protein